MSERYLNSREELSQSGFFSIMKVATWQGEKSHWVREYHTCDLGVVHSDTGILRRQLTGWQRVSVSIWQTCKLLKGWKGSHGDLGGCKLGVRHWTMTCRRGWLEWESLSHSLYNGICRSSFPYPPGTHGAVNPWRTTWRNLLSRRSSFTNIPLSNQNGKWWTSSIRYVVRKVHVDDAGHKWGIWGLVVIHLVDLLLSQALWWSSLTSN